jgi:Flp pilus assembly protein TadD
MRWGMAVAGLAVLLSGCASSTGVTGNAHAQMREGVRAAERNYWQEALFRFQRARQLKPNDVEVLNDLAVALEAMGRYDDALATYKEALKAAPRNSVIRKNYARFAEFYTSYAKGVKPKEGGDEGR